MNNDWIDITVPVSAGMVHWPSDPPVETHRVRDMAKGDPCNVTALTLGAHTGTHMDAPLHFLADGEGMEQVPLDAVMGPCRILEIKDPVAITPAELRPFALARGERVLFKTINSRHHWERAPFQPHFVYIPKDTAQYLVDCGVRTLGVDYLSVGGYKKDGKDTHQILLGARVWIIEGLYLGEVAPGNYDLLCLPLKLAGSDGAPARALVRHRP
jgi:arylformamidase